MAEAHITRCICVDGIVPVAVTRHGLERETGEHAQWWTLLEWRLCFMCRGREAFHSKPISITCYPDPPDVVVGDKNAREAAKDEHQPICRAGLGA